MVALVGKKSSGSCRFQCFCPCAPKKIFFPLSLLWLFLFCCLPSLFFLLHHLWHIPSLSHSTSRSLHQCPPLVSPHHHYFSSSSTHFLPRPLRTQLTNNQHTMAGVYKVMVRQPYKRPCAHSRFHYLAPKGTADIAITHFSYTTLPSFLLLSSTY